MRFAFLDIETLSLDSRAAITEVGIVVYEGAERIASECLFLKLDEQAKFFRTISSTTVEWHLKNNLDNFLYGLAAGRKDSKSLEEQLIEISFYLNPKNVDEIWSNHSDFDFPRLGSLFVEAGLSIPWGYRQVKDYFTLKEEFGHLVELEDYTASPNAHNAEGDAKICAENLIKIRGVIEKLKAGNE